MLRKAFFRPGLGAGQHSSVKHATGIIGPEHLVPGTFLTNDYADTIRAAAFAGDGSLLTGIVAASSNAGFTNVIVVPSATGKAATDTANLQWALDQTTKTRELLGRKCGSLYSGGRLPGE